MTRHGKIARLGHALREELNRRLREGETGRKLVAWINGLPEAQAVLNREFGARPLNEQNLSEWKNGGYREWLLREEIMAQADEIGPIAGQLDEAADRQLTENLATVVTAHYAAAMMQWEGGTVAEFRRRMRELRSLCRDVAVMRRGDYYSGWLKLERERLAWQRMKRLGGQEGQKIKVNQSKLNRSSP